MRSREFITERKRKRKKKSRRYGGYWYPGFAYGSSESGSEGGDGGGGESMYESTDISNEVEKFKDWVCQKLHIKNSPKIELSYDTEEAQEGHHTGRYVEGSGNIWIYAANRNLVDILRTIAHELTHVRQGELGLIDQGDSYPGSPIEAMADMLAGKYIKIYGKQNRKIFQ